MEIKRVGVVGCGIMGSGIAQVCAQSGYYTMVREVMEQALERGLNNIRAALTKLVERGRMTEQEKGETLGRLRGTTRLEDLSDCDLIIEAIVEDIGEKKKLFVELDSLCPPHTILATNTSSMTIIEIAAATRRPDKVVGIHFFNPAPVMKLVEVVRTIASSQESIDVARSFCESLGKTAVLAQDTPGFIVNRLLIPYLLDAIRLFESGLATKEDIDTGMTLGCGHPMGPLALVDLIGLDTVYHIANSMYGELGESRFAPPTLLKRMVLASHLGRKTGRGFYSYQQA